MSPAGVDELLAALSREKSVILALDFDGTLVPIRRHHTEPFVPPRLLSVLEAASRAPGVRLVFPSGRLRADLERRVGLRRAAYIGNHGLEARDRGWRWVHPRALDARPEAGRLAKELAAPVAAAGASLENKGLTLSLHYRTVQDRGRVVKLAHELKARLAARNGRFRILHGKKVWNIRPAIEWDKGKALLLWKRELGVRGRLVFIGDDLTDEEGFRSLGGRAWCVRVGRGRTLAGYRIAQKDVVRILRNLALRGSKGTAKLAEL